MKILKGFYQGVELAVPQDGNTRPTVDHLKKEIFKLVSSYNWEKVLDLYAGSGGVGLEFLSRGVKKVTFVEETNAAIQCIKLNAAECRLKAPEKFSNQEVLVVQSLVGEYLNRPPDQASNPMLIFMDPPYGQGLVGKTCLDLISSRWVRPGVFVLCEGVSDDDFIPESHGFRTIERRTMGPKSLLLWSC